MLAWRIALRRYALDRRGLGAALFGGRWNERDVPAIYAGATAEIAVLERFIHTAGRRPPELALVRIELPDEPDLYEHPNPKSLPRDWATTPAPPSTATFGTRFLREQRGLAMIVPSAVVPEARNLVINPLHLRMKDVKLRIVRPFSFDQRMFRR